MRIPFWKMHGAGNDFILVDDRQETFPAGNQAWMADLGTRRTGIGCDGFILIQPSKTATFSMRFFNPDGREAEMCGNGARCVARLAHDIGLAPERMTIQTVAGQLDADIVGPNVRLHMTPPRDWTIHADLTLDDQTLDIGFVNTGVPHAVVEVEHLQACDVQTIGAAIRYHKDFAPAGTNANFITVSGPKALSIRTYERGVEAETLACGTGIVASALVAARRDRVSPPVQVSTAGRDTLTVDFTLTDDSADNVTLLGPAVHVFQGTLEEPSRGHTG